MPRLSNEQLIASSTYRKVPTPGFPGTAPFIHTADISVAPEVLRMVTRDFPIRFQPASRDPAPLSMRSSGYDELFMSKLHTPTCARDVACACQKADMRIHGHWYRNTHSV